MSSTHPSRPERRRGRGAFTLIELLVVIAIIALLVSILLPSLTAAKELARSAVCMAHARGFVSSLNMYASTFNQSFPGPNTTGWALGDPYHLGRPPVMDDPDDPVQDWDWLSPLEGRDAGLPKDRLERFEEICMRGFRCPSNTTRYLVRYSGEELPMTKGSGEHPYILSYVTSAYMHLLPSNTPERQYIEKNNTGESISLPNGYRPRIDRLGLLAKKAFVYEGGRYYDTRRSQIGLDYTTGTNTTGLVGSPQGNFTSRGMAFKGQGEPMQLQNGSSTLHPWLKKNLYRHNGRMTIGYFDCHVESVDWKDTLDPTLYVPKGTRLKHTGALVDGARFGMSGGYVFR